MLPLPTLPMTPQLDCSTTALKALSAVESTSLIFPPEALVSIPLILMERDLRIKLTLSFLMEDLLMSL